MKLQSNYIHRQAAVHRLVMELQMMQNTTAIVHISTVNMMQRCTKDRLI